MRSFLHPIAIMPVFIVLFLFQTSFAQVSDVGHVPLIHPGILMTGEQLDLMRDRINNGIEPQKSAFDTLKNDSRASKSYKPDPKTYIEVPSERPNTNWPEAEKDAQACWIQALMWSVTQEEVYAENVMNIMEAWGRSLKEIGGRGGDLRIGLMGTMFMRGAEIVKHTYPKWRPETETIFMDMYDKLFMPTLLKRVEHENNWMSSITESLMATAIFKDDPELFDLAVYRLKIYLPTNIPFENGQPAELYRDIPHTQQGIGALVQTAEIARNQGIDAYAWLDNRLATAIEFLGEIIDTKQSGFKGNSPFPMGWEIAYNHYHYRMGMDMPWTKNLVKKVRPEGLRRHTSLGTLTKGEMDKDRPVAISHWRLPIAYSGASYSHQLKRYGCASQVEWVQDAKTTIPSALNISSNGQVIGNVEADSGVYEIILKSSGTSCNPVSTTYYLPVKNLLPAAEVKVTDPGLWYEYRTPHFDTDPGLDSVQSNEAGTTSTFSYSVAKDEKYAIRFSGYLDVPVDGGYSFQVGTENQSRLYIDDQLVVDHWMRDNRARIAWDDFDSELGLKTGKHKIVLTVNNGNYDRYNLYGEFPSMRNLFEVQWKIPGTTSHVPIPKSALFNPGNSSVLPLGQASANDADSIYPGILHSSAEQISTNLLGYIVPKNSSEITSSPFGIQAGTSDDTLLVKAAQIGIKWTRLLAGWGGIEKEKGVYNWDETDEAINAVLKHGITPFVTLTNGNRHYCGIGKYDDPKLAAIYGESIAPPVGSKEETEAWLNFVEAAVKRYGDKITYWEIWNEPNHRKYWGAPPNAVDYGRLVKVTTEKIRTILPDAKIIAGSTAGLDPEYNDTFLNQCDPKSLDIISFHQYDALPENRAFQIDVFLKAIYKHNPNFEIWQGECGFPSSSRTTGFRARAPWGLNIQAKWLLRQSIVDTYFCRATLSNYFLLAHYGTMTPDLNRPEKSEMEKIFGFPERDGSRVHFDGVNEKCILFRENYKPKPAYYAYQNLCAAWTQEYKAFPVAYDVTLVDQGIFYGIGEYEDAFPSVPLVATYSAKNGNKLVAWWLPWNMQENLQKLATVYITLEGIQFDDPVMLDPLSGEVYEVNVKNDGKGCVMEQVVLADYPMIVVERETIKFN